MNLVLIEPDTHHFPLDFKHFDEDKNAIIPGRFYLQLLNKNDESVQRQNEEKNLSLTWPYGVVAITVESPNYRLVKISEVGA